MTATKLRNYQSRALEELDAWFAENETGNPIVSACVGAGKSVIIAEFCRRAVLDYPDYRARILMLVPTKELVVQNWEKLMPMTKDIYIGIISASLGRKDTAFDKDVIIATVGSVAKNPGSLGRIDLILIDECHLVSRKNTGQYRRLINDCRRYNPQVRVVGLTGTPFRGDGVWLTEGNERLFTDIAARVTIRELLQSNPPYLSPLVNADPSIQISGDDVKMNGGDFVISDLAKKIDKAELTEKVARKIVELGEHRKKWLVFCVTVEHADHMAEELRGHGLKIAVVSAKTPSAERDRALQDLKSGRIRGICNVACMTTGVDIPDLDLIALVRNTRSPVLYIQIAGRGFRIHDDKTDCLWLDFTDTTIVMGPVDQVRGRGEPKPFNHGEGGATSPFKVCHECGVSTGTATLLCKCGYAFPPPELAINDSVSDANVLSPQGFNTYPLARVTYSRHQNRKNPDKPPTLKVSYWSGMKIICSEWVCLEHEGFSRAKATKWWGERINAPIYLPYPLTVDEALSQTQWLKMPSSIVVKEGSDWPELIRCIFEVEVLEKEGGTDDDPYQCLSE